MYQPGSIATPGTSIQGQLLRHVSPPGEGTPDAALRTMSVLPQTISQCGVPAVLARNDGSLEVFVAGQVNGRNSPFSAPWPLSPLYLHTGGKAEEWQITKLPDHLNGRQYFVSGIPSAVVSRDEVLVYFNGAQLLEYRCSPERWWQFSAVPAPDMIVQANPVAAIADGCVFVFCIPAGASPLMCSRRLDSPEWHFANLIDEDVECVFDGDPAVVSFGGGLHVFVSVRASNLFSGNPGSFELWQLVVDPVTLETTGNVISRRLTIGDSRPANTIVGTPSAVVTAGGLRVFARSADDRLIEFASADGTNWELAHAWDMTIGGDPGAVLSPDGTPLVCAVDKRGHLLRFSCAGGTWLVDEISPGPNEVEQRPLPVVSGGALSVFDLKVAL